MLRKTSLPLRSPEDEHGFEGTGDDEARSAANHRRAVKRVKRQLDGEAAASVARHQQQDAAGEEEEEEETEGDDGTSGSGSSDGGSDGESEEEADDGEKERGPADSTAFGRAFRKIMKKKLPSTTLTEAMGPMLCAHKQLVTKKLEEAITERKAKSKSKREKQALREKGHTIMGRYPVAKDKELIKLATKGVVKLFNAVSKAQSVQEAAKTSKESEVKEVVKRSKSTFLAMLQGGNGAVSQTLNTQQRLPDSNKEGAIEDQPGWSALRDSFMLGKSRLKDWDTKQDGEADLKGAESSDDESFSE